MRSMIISTRGRAVPPRATPRASIGSSSPMSRLAAAGRRRKSGCSYASRKSHALRLKSRSRTRAKSFDDSSGPATNGSLAWKGATAAALSREPRLQLRREGS